MTNKQTLSNVNTLIAQSVLFGAGETGFQRVHSDTRSIQAGDLFVALKGDRFDGNDYLVQARSQGAAAALSSSATKLTGSGLPGIVVEDTRLALGELAGAWRRQFSLELIAVTGSNGKTTVTQMVAAILRAFRPKGYWATAGNFNNDIGLPLTLLGLRSQHECAVVEIGMNHPGEIEVLTRLAAPTVALVNNAQREHQEFMLNVAEVARENGKAIEQLAPNGKAVFPSMDEFTPMWRRMATGHQVVDFALSDPAAAVHCVEYTWTGRVWKMVVNTPSGDLSYELGIAGLHNAINSLAAVACACAAGVPLGAIAEGLTSFEPVKGRSKTQFIHVQGRQVVLIDDTYNANPDSVRAAIDALKGLPAPHLLVLGDMGEVGEKGPEFHTEVGSYAKSQGIEQVMTFGLLSRGVQLGFGGVDHFQDIESLNVGVLSRAQACNSILIKGSRFMKMERVVEFLLAQAPVSKGVSCS